MRLVYLTAYEGDIVLCEAPPGTAILWPGSLANGLKTRRSTVLPLPWVGWKVCRTLKDGLEPRTRILAVADEILATEGSLASAIRRAFKRLPKSRQNRGALGVILKGRPYEADGKKRRLIGFFHVLRPEAWDDMLGIPAVELFAPPPGFPKTVSCS